MKKYIMIFILTLSLFLTGCDPDDNGGNDNPCVGEECNIPDELTELEQLFEDRNIVNGEMTTEEVSEVLTMLEEYNFRNSVLSADNIYDYDFSHFDTLDLYILEVVDEYYNAASDVTKYFDLGEVNVSGEQLFDAGTVEYFVYKLDDNEYKLEITDGDKELDFTVDLEEEEILLDGQDFSTFKEVEETLFGEVYDDYLFYSVQEVEGYYMVSYSESFVHKSHYIEEDDVFPERVTQLVGAGMEYTRKTKQEMLVFNPYKKHVLTVEVTPVETELGNILYDVEVNGYTEDGHYYIKNQLNSYSGYLSSITNVLDLDRYDTLEASGKDDLFRMINALPANFARVNMYSSESYLFAKDLSQAYYETSDDPNIEEWSFEEHLGGGTTHFINHYTYNDITVFKHDYVVTDEEVLLSSNWYESDLVTNTLRNIENSSDMCEQTSSEEISAPDEYHTTYSSKSCDDNGTVMSFSHEEEINGEKIVSHSFENYPNGLEKSYEIYTKYTNDNDEIVISYMKRTRDENDNITFFTSWEETNGVKVYFDENGLPIED